MIIAIVGTSCTGKTSIAVPLAEELGFVLRSCGEEIKRKAKELNVAINELPDDIHSAIDGETIAWIQANADCIVEGRFLDFVLSPIRAQVILIRLTASDTERCARMQKRGLIDFTTMDLCNLDEIDETFRTRHYKGILQAESSITIDTSSLSAIKCAKLIKSKLLAIVA
jgi:cytidylate kinase